MKKNASGAETAKSKPTVRELEKRVLRAFPLACYGKNPMTGQHVIFTSNLSRVLATSWISELDAWKQAALAARRKHGE